MLFPLTVISPSADFTSACKRPRTESYFSRCASVFVSVKSLVATISTPASGLLSAARNTLRPIRPKPLIATLMAMQNDPFKWNANRNSRISKPAGARPIPTEFHVRIMTTTLLRGLQRRRGGTAETGVGVLDRDDLTVGESDEGDAAGREAVDPILGLEAVLGFTHLVARHAHGQQDLVAGHPDGGALGLDGLLDFLGQGGEVVFRGAARVEVEHGLEDALHLRGRDGRRDAALPVERERGAETARVVAGYRLRAGPSNASAHLHVPIPLALGLEAAIDHQDNLVVLELHPGHLDLFVDARHGAEFGPGCAPAGLIVGAVGVDSQRFLRVRQKGLHLGVFGRETANQGELLLVGQTADGVLFTLLIGRGLC